SISPRGRPIWAAPRSPSTPWRASSRAWVTVWATTREPCGTLSPTSAWPSCRSGAQRTLPDGGAAEPAGGSVHDLACTHRDAFGREQAGLCGLVARHEPAAARHDPPPRHLDVARCEQPADEPAAARIAGDVGDVAVADDLSP